MTNNSRPDAEKIDSRLEKLLHEAEEHMQEGAYRKAAEIALEATREFPQSPLPFHALSVVYLRLLQSDIEHLEMWEDLSDDEAYCDAAIGAAKTAIDLDEEFVPARNNLAMLYAVRGWWDEAVKQWETSLSIQPDQSQVRQDLADGRRHLS